MSAESNWTTHPELAALVTDLEELCDRAEAIGEDRLALVLRAVATARIVDGDESQVALKRFDSAVMAILEAIGGKDER